MLEFHQCYNNLNDILILPFQLMAFKMDEQFPGDGFQSTFFYIFYYIYINFILGFIISYIRFYLCFHHVIFIYQF